MSEKEKMLAGEIYNPMDKDLGLARDKAHALCRKYNESDPLNHKERRQILTELFDQKVQAWIEAPFQCDYGSNIHLGKQVFINMNCVILDGAEVTIGNNVFIGPAVQIYTAQHPINAAMRRKFFETAAGVSIGDDVWIGGAAVILPGVSIGAKSIVGAGAVVTKDVPEGVIVGGNPAKVIRELSEEELAE